MRISDSAKRAMKSEILTDLYKDSEDKLDERKSAIAEQSRKYYLQKHQAVIDQMPNEMLTKNRTYELEIKYKLDPEDSDVGLTQSWYYRTELPQLNPTRSGMNTYSSDNPAEQKLDERLQVQAAALAEDIIALRTEKRELHSFLTDTLEQWSGPVQLKTVWPQSLHKYLPVPKPRTPKAKVDKPAAPVAAVAPTSLNTRLTTNLLEGS